MPRSESFHHRRPAGPTAAPLPLTRGLAGMPPLGGSPDWGMPYVVQCPLPAESMSAAEPARNFLRRTFCAAYGAEFFFTKKWVGGRSSLRKYQRGSEAGTKILPPIPPKTGFQRDASLWQELEDSVLEVLPFRTRTTPPDAYSSPQWAISQSISSATPLSSQRPVTRSAADLTASGALPMATPMPARQSISASL